MSLHVVPTPSGRGVSVVEDVGSGTIVRLPEMSVVDGRALALELLKAYNSAANDAEALRKMPHRPPLIQVDDP